MLRELAESLARIGAQGSFATRRSVPPGDLKLEVQGVGRIRLPIAATTARKLCAVARPARHGYKDQTRLDPRVRDTREIAKNRISIDQPRWQKTLAPELERIRRDLGLPEGCRLKAQLHNLLIYAPGQFFVTHQDSEKADDMIGTLVVSLPTQFTGGTMIIEHHDETLRVGGSDRHLTFVAFYGDCRHEVRPVKKGYRVVLTYNLIAESDATAAGTPAASTEALTRCVREFFERSPRPRWEGDQDRESPDRLVYLLDHEYTQRGLSWNRLKGADAQRATALREVARQLDCEIFLALADVHETWACEEEYPDYGYRSRRRWHYDDEEEAGDEDDFGSESEPELTELVDSDVELRHWVGHDGESRGRTKAMLRSVGGHELCYTKSSVEFEPFESKHEGYMGNWGNTVDRWYHRAAVVLWPRERTFVIRAKASPQWAMSEIGKLLKAKNVPQAAVRARRLLPFWPEVSMREKQTPLLDRILVVAAKLEDEKIAAALLEPFTLTDVTRKLAPRLIDLLDRYGAGWSRKLLRHWLSEEKRREPPETRLSWLAGALPALCTALG
ncbi:MAG: 2OG-Fe(II) oxygenase, partial [Steroidobacteraceae bacterium]